MSQFEALVLLAWTYPLELALRLWHWLFPNAQPVFA